MSGPNQNTQPTQQPKSDKARVRVITRLLVGREIDTANRQTTSELYAEPGEIIELPRAEAEKLAGRSFEGYPCRHDERWVADQRGNVVSGGTQCGSRPADPDGKVKDPVVEILS